MSDSEKRRRWRAKLEPKGAVATPAEAAAIEVLRELEARDVQLRDARREGETFREEADAQRARATRAEAERDLMQRLAAEAVDGARARSVACSETCAKAAREVEAVRAEREGIRDQLGVANVARQEMAAAFVKLSARVDDLERRRADVLSPLAELRAADDGRGGTDRPDFGRASTRLDELARGSPTEGDCQSPPAHTLGARGGP